LILLVEGLIRHLHGADLCRLVFLHMAVSEAQTLSWWHI
jgi:hypothetical protein